VKLSYIWDLIFFSALVYLLIRYRSANSHAQIAISRARQALFYLGWALLALVLVGPIPHLAVRIFTIHMIQHISIMMLISPLLILGGLGELLYSDTTFYGRYFRRITKFSWFRILFKAEVGFAIFLATLLATHFGPLANAGMRNPNFHILELMLFLAGGLIYYYSVMSGNRQPFAINYPIRVVSLFAMMLPETMTGFFLYSGNRVLHSLPAGMSMGTGLKDQHNGGAIMWAMGMLIDTIWIATAVREWFKFEESKSEEEENEPF
jgi:putative copper resistance protein D